MQYVAFEASDEDFGNPGRGLQRSYEEEIGSWQTIDDADETTPRRQMYLPVTEGPLSQALLDGVRRDLEWARGQGLLVDLRFAYSHGFGVPEPSYAAILRHQEQLAPIVHEFAHILNALALGLIGPWGEQHSVRAAGFGEADDAGAYPKRLELLRGWLDGAPRGLVVALRYPHQLRWMIEEGGLTEGELARTAIYNDGFLANLHHEGTFRVFSDNERLEDEKRWLAEYSKTHPSRAESNVEQAGAAEYAKAETNWLTDGFARYHVDTLREWGLVSLVLQPRNVWADVQRKLGYRLVVRGAVLPENVQPGERITVAFQIENEGYAPPRRERLMVLHFGDQPALVEGIDTRTWLPGSRTVRGEVIVPELPDGTYELTLGLPDFAPALQSDARYSIRLANEGVWDATSGTNRMNATTTIVG